MPQSLYGLDCKVEKQIEVVTCQIKQSVKLYYASAGRKRSWIIYCWLVWCRRKILFQLIIHDRIRTSEQAVNCTMQVQAARSYNWKFEITYRLQSSPSTRSQNRSAAALACARWEDTIKRTGLRERRSLELPGTAAVDDASRIGRDAWGRRQACTEPRTSCRMSTRRSPRRLDWAAKYIHYRV